MKFKFPFEKLLEHRQRTEDEAQRVFLIARNNLESAQAELKAMYDSITQTRNLASGLRGQGGNCVAHLQGTDFFIAGQEVRIAHQRQKIRELVSIAEQKHAILVEASQETKKVKKLRERMLERHQVRVKRREAKEQDDMVTMRFGRET